jgi:hypothetical protein
MLDAMKLQDLVIAAPAACGKGTLIIHKQTVAYNVNLYCNSRWYLVYH